MASEQDRLAVLEKINKAKERYNRLQETAERTGRDYTRSLTRQLTSIKELGSELKDINSSIQERLDFYKDEEASIGRITDSYKGDFVKSQKEVLSIASSMGESVLPEQREVIRDILSISRELADSSVEDVMQQTALRESLDSQLTIAGALLAEHQDIITALRGQAEISGTIAQLTEAERSSLENTNQLTEFIKDNFGSILETMQTLTSGPMGALGVILGGIGTAVNAVGKNVREFGGTMSGAVYSTTLLGTVFDDAVGTAKGLAQEFGGMEDVSFATQLNTNLMATNMGISGDEAAKTLSIFSRLNSNSKDTAFNMADSVASMSRASGLDTSQVMGDIAANAESFAEYSQDGGKNMGLAAVQAAKLGVSMGTLTNITDSLLDFETSITKELELGAMLGKNINLNRARGLAYEGKVGASVKETIKQLGGVAEYNKMDIFAKRETAKLLGINQDELSKLVNNMENLNDDGSLQLSTWGSITEAVKAFATGPMGTVLQSLGGAAIAAGQMGFNVAGVIGKIPILGGLLTKLGLITNSTASSIAPSILPEPTDVASSMTESVVPTDVGTPEIKSSSIGDKLKDLASGLSEMGTGKVLFGALNLIPTALGFVTILPGIPGMIAVGAFGSKAGTGLVSLGLGLQMMGTGSTLMGALALSAAAIGFTLMTAGVIGLGAIALLGTPAGAGLTALAGGLTVLGGAASIGFIGIALLAGFGLALIPLTYALSLLSPLVESFSTVITSTFAGIGTVISSVTASISTFMGSITLESVASIGLLSLAFIGLASSLMFLGTAGIFALPALLGIAAASTGLSMVANILGVGGESSGGENSAVEKGSLSEYEETMLEKMDSLISAVSANKDVYLDKDRVTSLVMQKSDRSILNKLNIFNA